MDLICQNTNAHPVRVTLDIDLSQEGRRTDYDNKPEAGMKLRDFVFIQRPEHEWHQLNGATEGWVAKVSFEVPPGATKIALSPWYTYSDYVQFVHSLPMHPHLAKRLAGKTDHVREHCSRKGDSPRSPIDPPWRIGEFFGNDDAMDVLSQQTGSSGDARAGTSNLNAGGAIPLRSLQA
jgi:hypothetical protein